MLWSSMLIFRVSYARLGDLRQDADQQLAYGGMALRVGSALPRPLSPNEAARLELVLPGPPQSEPFVAEVQALQVLGEVVMLAFPPAQVRALQERISAAAAARHGADPAASPPRHEVRDGDAGEGASPPPAAEAPRTSKAPQGREGVVLAQKRIETMTSAEKIQLALHGDADERVAVLRDKNKTLHPFVLRNPGITPEEVLAIAKNPASMVELLEIIGGKREWIGKPQVALALVRNAKVPQGVGLRALEFINHSDLRLIAKGEGAPTHIVAAARKKLLR